MGDGTYAVPEPVGGGRETDASGSDGQGIDLSDDDPCAWTPGGGEEEDVDADKRDHGLDSLPVFAVRDTNDGNDEFTCEHADGTPDEQRTTTELLNRPEGDRGRADVDQGGDQADEEGIVDGSQVLEEGGAKVEDEVDTGELLEHLQGGSENDTTDVAGRVEEAAAEAMEPGSPVSVGDGLHLVLVVGNDFSQLLTDIVRVSVLASEPGQHGLRILHLALLDEVARRFGEQEESTAQDESPEHLQSNRDTVRARVLAGLGAVVDTGSQQQADGDAELVSRDDGASHLSGRNLRHVQDDDG